MSLTQFLKQTTRKIKTSLVVATPQAPSLCWGLRVKPTERKKRKGKSLARSAPEREMPVSGEAPKQKTNPNSRSYKGGPRVDAVMESAVRSPFPRRIEEYIDHISVFQYESTGDWFFNILSILRVWYFLYRAAGWDALLTVSDIDQFFFRADQYRQSGVSWVAWAKYKNSAFFAAWEGQELPPCPLKSPVDNPRVLLGGSFYQYNYYLRNSDRSRWDWFILSILHSKKGMPRPGIEMQEEAIVKTVTLLTTKPVEKQVFLHAPAHSLKIERDWMVDDGVSFYVAEEKDPNCFFPPAMVGADIKALLILELKRVTRAIFRDSSFLPNDQARPVFPSINACGVWSKALGGSACFISQLCHSMFPVEAMGLDCLEFVSEMREFRSRISDYYGEKGRIDQDLLDIDDGFTELFAYKCVNTEFLKVWHRLYWLLFNEALKEDPHVKPVALAEALKVRVISKGPPITYFVLKTFQKFLLNRIQKFPQFSLTGHPVTAEEMNDVFADYIGGEFLSGDFVASTDKLMSWVSEEINDEIFHQIGGYGASDSGPGMGHSSLKTLVKRALTGHTFCPLTGGTPTKVGNRTVMMFKKSELLAQQNGQLMGSVVSFPYLCIANLSIASLVYKLSGYNYPLYKLPVKINGDDSALANKARKPQFYPIWKAVSRVAGLETSVGKTYYTDKFVVINSAHFDVKGSELVERKYINLGLLYGLIRSGEEGSSNESLSSLGQKSRTLLDMAPCSAKTFLHHHFVRIHKKLLASFPGPWFIPEYLGGVGLVPLDGYSIKDKMAAYQMHKYINAGKGPREVKNVEEWIMRKGYLDYCRDKCPLLCEYPFRRTANEQLEAQTTVLLVLLISKMGHGIISTPGDKLIVAKARAVNLRYNCSLWQKCTKATIDCRLVEIDVESKPEPTLNLSVEC